ncbi:MAG: DNA-processing protein DprA [Sphaerimonospora mesophila]
MNKVKQISPLNHPLLQRVSVIDKPATNIWYIGEIAAEWANRPTVAIVGSRKPTDYGRSVTLKLASALAARGVIIVSGLALGHDALAARGALDASGTTIAVIGNGLNNIHPRSNTLLAKEIIEKGGVILSEYEPDYPVYKQNFLERNRLITALSDITVVVEAGERSGTLNTAAHALAQNRELMVVPGNITSPLSIGCNRLIAQGAEPVLSADDIIEKLRQIHASRGNNQATRYLLDKTTATSTNPTGSNQTETKILRTIASGISDGDEILKATRLDPSDYNVALTMLELDGRIQPLGANRWTMR